MELIFKTKEILTRSTGLSFDHVTLIPRYSEITSEHLPSLETRLTKNYKINLPLVSANMDTISESIMCMKMMELGGVGVLHRYMTPERQKTELKAIIKFKEEKKLQSPVVASVGILKDEKLRAKILCDSGVQALVIDIAHGDCVAMYDFIAELKKDFPHVDIIGGNVATSDGVRRMIENGVDAVKVGIGVGSMSMTRTFTGHGVPTLTAIALANSIAGKYDIPIIADGGIKNSGDIVKALAAGASSVMLGSLIAGCDETPELAKDGYKLYRGMSSTVTQESWVGDMSETRIIEGESKMVPNHGPVENVVRDLSHGVLTGMTFLGAKSIEEMKDAARYIEIPMKR